MAAAAAAVAVAAAGLCPSEGATKLPAALRSLKAGRMSPTRSRDHDLPICLDHLQDALRCYPPPPTLLHNTGGFYEYLEEP